jgi:excisionase family DNA binding protein
MKKTSTVTPAVMDIPDAARYLSTTERQIRELVYKRRIPYTKVGKFVRFRASDLDAWLERNSVSISPWWER